MFDFVQYNKASKLCDFVIHVSNTCMRSQNLINRTNGKSARFVILKIAVKISQQCVDPVADIANIQTYVSIFLCTVARSSLLAIAEAMLTQPHKHMIFAILLYGIQCAGSL